MPLALSREPTQLMKDDGLGHWSVGRPADFAARGAGGREQAARTAASRSRPGSGRSRTRRSRSAVAVGLLLCRCCRACSRWPRRWPRPLRSPAGLRRRSGWRRPGTFSAQMPHLPLLTAGRQAVARRSPAARAPLGERECRWPSAAPCRSRMRSGSSSRGRTFQHWPQPVHFADVDVAGLLANRDAEVADETLDRLDLGVGVQLDAGDAGRPRPSAA